MSPEQTKALLPVITAFAEGKEIQVYNSTTADWVDSKDPNWYGSLQYRIKPREFSIWCLVSNNYEVYHEHFYTKEGADYALNTLAPSPYFVTEFKPVKP